MLDVRRLRVLREVAARGSFSAAARALVDHADAILARLEDAEEELAAIAGLRGGRLRIATFQSAGATLVPRAVGEFHRRHPDVDVTVRQDDFTADQQLTTGEVDLAIIMDFEHTPL